MGTFTQSVAIGLPLTFIVVLLAANAVADGRQLAALTLACATLSSFGAAFLRELYRRISRNEF